MLVAAAGGLSLGVAVRFGRDSARLATTAGAAAHPSPEARSRAASSPGASSPGASSPRATSPGAGSRIAATTGASPTAAPADRAHVVAATDPRQPTYYLDDGPKVIALTIDDGPSPVYTPQVLRILEKYRLQAAFSMVGQNVTYYPSLAREVAEAGHTIVNHTWDHANLTRLSATRQRTEIARAADAIHGAAGTLPRMFRAPYGAWSTTILEYCQQEGIVPLDWSVDPADWSRPGVSKIVAAIMRTTRTGSIILEHDGGGNRAQTVAALKIVIPRLLDEGYRFAAP
jgi:peptidoglycan/xylan/chitin deacetylase (PgdA/CDA1 family)